MFNQKLVNDLPNFLCKYGEQLTDEPYRGILLYIKWEFDKFCGGLSEEGVPAFLKLLFDFNVISNEALTFEKNYQFKDVPFRLIYINLLKVQLVQKLSVSISETSSTSSVSNLKQQRAGKQSLLQILTLTKKQGFEGPNDQQIVDGNYDLLSSILTKPTAFTQLSIQRAKDHFGKKPFYLACNDSHHNKILAEICLSFRSASQNVLDLPANSRLHKIISSSRSGISEQVLTCVKSKVHYLPLVTNITDVSLGNCSYLDTCHKLRNCRYLHFYTLNPSEVCGTKKQDKSEFSLDFTIGEAPSYEEDLPAQWINCDVRHLPFNVLGKFAAIISDPPWDIHMSLPYGTCKDAELMSMSLSELQDEGILFLWVTGRSIEVGRKALAQWGYTICDEMIWIKLNQLRRTIVTGRTGHWLNHSKENLIVGVKGNPIWLNRKIDLDYMVSGSRETSRKPDELYEIVERLVGRNSRKLELFGRDHNIRPGWFSTLLSMIRSDCESDHKNPYIYTNLFSNRKPVTGDTHL